MHSRPHIGITPDLSDVAAPETEYVVRRNYADVVLEAGGLPFILPYSMPVEEYLGAIDGLLITGGMFDIDPALYGQTARKSYTTKPARTDFEMALAQGALSRRIPILGICNGMQLLSVCLGGRLVQDIPSEIEDAIEHKPDQSATVAQHAVEIISESRYLPCSKGTSYPVNSVHHQAVLPAGGYNVIATSRDGVIEAIEAIDGGFAFGVQWHPEYGASKIDAAVWSSFLVAAKDYAMANR